MRKKSDGSFSPAAEILHDFFDLIYPRLCPICGRSADLDLPNTGRRGEAFERPEFCAPCRRRTVAPLETLCPFCAGSARYGAGDTDRCGSCRGQTFRFERVLALGGYEPPLRDQILLMKRQRSGWCAAAFGRLLVSERREAFESLGADLVVPTPMHFFRRFCRGVNLTTILAESLARSLGLPYERGLLTRCRATLPQSSLSVRRRRENVVGAFAVSAKRLRRVESIQNAHILLVDDILTTGATANEISRVLLDAGAGRVSVAVLARAEG